MDREWGAQDALAFVRRTDFAPSAVAFDAAMQQADAMSGCTGRRASGGRRPPIGVGMLGYAFMGKAHSNALQKLAVHGLAAAAPAAAGLDRRPQRGGGRRGRASATATSAASTDWRELVADPDDRAVRQRRPEQPARRADDRRGRGGQARRLREAARPRRRRELRDLAAGRGRPASSTCAPSTTASCRPCGSRAR